MEHNPHNMKNIGLRHGGSQNWWMDRWEHCALGLPSGVDSEILKCWNQSPLSFFPNNILCWPWGPCVHSEPWLTTLLKNTFPNPLVDVGAGWWWLVLGTALLLLWQPLCFFSHWCYQDHYLQFSLSSIRVEGIGFFVGAHAEKAHLKHVEGVRHTQTPTWQLGNDPQWPYRPPPKARSSLGSSHPVTVFG